MSTENKEVSVWKRIQWICDMIFHQLTAAVTVVILWVLIHNNQVNKVTFWHYVLNTLAYVPLMAEGCVIFSDANGWTRKLSRTARYIIHGTMLSFSTLAVTAGSACFIYHKNQHGNSPHFKSDHAITGLVSWLLCITSVIFGLTAANSKKLKNLVRPVVLKFIHNFLGLAAFSIGLASLILGLQYKHFAKFLTENEKASVDAMVILVGLYAGSKSLTSLFHQLKEIISS